MGLFLTSVFKSLNPKEQEEDSKEKIRVLDQKLKGGVILQRLEKEKYQFRSQGGGWVRDDEGRANLHTASQAEPSGGGLSPMEMGPSAASPRPGTQRTS